MTVGCSGEDVNLSCSSERGTEIYIVWEETYFWMSKYGAVGKPWNCTDEAPQILHDDEGHVCSEEIRTTNDWEHWHELNNCSRKRQCSVRGSSVQMARCSKAYRTDVENVTYKCVYSQSTSK